MSVFTSSNVTSARRADLDDKRVILPHSVGHFKDRHFTGRSMERSDDGEARLDRRVCMCAFVCAGEKGRTQGACRDSRRQRSSRLGVFHTALYSGASFMHVHKHRGKHANDIQTHTPTHMETRSSVNCIPPPTDPPTDHPVQYTCSASVYM